MLFVGLIYIQEDIYEEIQKDIHKDDYKIRSTWHGIFLIIILFLHQPTIDLWSLERSELLFWNLRIPLESV